MNCLRLRCYSPTACDGFGHCRERNFEPGKIELAAHELERVILALRRLDDTQATRDLINRFEVMR